MIYQFIQNFWAWQTLAVITSVRSGTGPRSCPKGSDKSAYNLWPLVGGVFYIMWNIWIFCQAAPYAVDVTEKHRTKPRPSREEWLQYLSIPKTLYSCRTGDSFRKTGFPGKAESQICFSIDSIGQRARRWQLTSCLFSFLFWDGHSFCPFIAWGP